MLVVVRKLLLHDFEELSGEYDLVLFTDELLDDLKQLLLVRDWEVAKRNINEVFLDPVREIVSLKTQLRVSLFHTLWVLDGKGEKQSLILF